jgi:transcriptional regulator with XRE-family HTH domain
VHVEAEEWRSGLVQAVAQQVRRRRLEIGLSVQRLADICSEEYGVPMKRSVLANFEGGRRPALSVVELLVLARILAIPPAELLFPIGREKEIEVLPGKRTDPWTALKWFNGESDRLPSDTEFTQDNAAARLYREHERAVEEWHEVQRRVKAFVSAVGEELKRPEPTPDSMNRAPLWDEAATELRNSEEAIRRVRKTMRAHGLTPPDLWDGLARIDQMGDE